MNAIRDALYCGLIVLIVQSARAEEKFACVGDIVEAPPILRSFDSNKHREIFAMTSKGSSALTSPFTVHTMSAGVGAAKFQKGPNAIGLLFKLEFDEIPVLDEGVSAMCINGIRGATSYGMLKCTASWVGQNLIVTANHCVPNDLTKLIWVPNFSTVLSTEPYNYDGERYAVVKVDYQSPSDIGDLALLTVEYVPTEKHKLASKIDPLPIAWSLPKSPRDLNYYGHFLGGSLVGVERRSDALPGPQLLENWVRAPTGKSLDQMFCASTDQTNGGSGGPFLDAHSNSLVGVLFGGKGDWVECGKKATGQCKNYDLCLASDSDYYGDIATRTDVLCEPCVLPEDIRKKLTCAP